MASDNREKFTQAANGQTAGSYTTDGDYNRGGWATYPSKDELAISSKRPPILVFPKSGKQPSK